MGYSLCVLLLLVLMLLLLLLVLLMLKHRVGGSYVDHRNAGLIRLALLLLEDKLLQDVTRLGSRGCLHELSWLGLVRSRNNLVSLCLLVGLLKELLLQLLDLLLLSLLVLLLVLLLLLLLECLLLLELLECLLLEQLLLLLLLLLCSFDLLLQL